MTHAGELYRMLECQEQGDFDRVGAVEDAIRSIETATTHPELRSIKR